MTTKRDWKADVDVIRRILMSDWDPIGCGVPDDEYDSYIPGIYALMQRSVAAYELAAYLESIETGAMNLEPRPTINLKVAKLLSDLMKESS